MSVSRMQTSSILQGFKKSRSFLSENVAFSVYPDIVVSGLVLNVDAGHPTSYGGTGTSFLDISGNGNHGTLTNGPTYNSANSGSIVFDGVDDYVSFSGTSITTATATFIVWMKRDGTQDAYDGIFFSRSTDTSGFNFSGTANNLGYTWNGTVGSYSYASGLVPPLNAWSMCALVVSSSTAKFYLYQTSGNTTATNTHAHTSTVINQLRLGQDTYSTRYMKGSIGQASIYNRALSDAEVLQNFNALKDRYGI